MGIDIYISNDDWNTMKNNIDIACEEYKVKYAGNDALRKWSPIAFVDYSKTVHYRNSKPVYITQKFCPVLKFDCYEKESDAPNLKRYHSNFGMGTDRNIEKFVKDRPNFVLNIRSVDDGCISGYRVIGADEGEIAWKDLTDYSDWE